jgi:putative heme-binding domain-containing protein
MAGRNAVARRFGARAVVVRAALLAAGTLGGALGFSEEAEPAREASSAEDLAAGRRLFESQCTRCHGREGAGGSGPSLQRARLRRAPDDPALLAVVREGIRGTSMPGSWQLTDRQISQVAAYVRSLGRLPARPIPGQAGRGRALFEGRGGCAACHIVDGKGGWQGPELSDVGLRRGPDHLRASILDPAADGPTRPVDYEPGTYAAYLAVRAVSSGGRRLEGRRVNEDSFTIQIRDAAGRLHSLRKSEVQLTKLPGRSLMPSYRGVFSGKELDDLVAYLASLRSDDSVP